MMNEETKTQKWTKVNVATAQVEQIKEVMERDPTVRSVSYFVDLAVRRALNSFGDLA